MSKIFYGCMVVLCCAVMMLNGCAKQQAVVPDEKPAPTVAPPPTPIAVEPSRPLSVKTEPVAAPTIKETPIASAEVPKEASSATVTASNFDAIYFAFDSSELSQDSRSILSKTAELLKKDTASKIQIEGHCDERGSAEYNLALGERRAKSALQYLVNLGVKAGRLATLSYGKERPADKGNDEAAWAKNRRDEFVVVK